MFISGKPAKVGSLLLLSANAGGPEATANLLLATHSQRAPGVRRV
jgi:hypothetical protein